MIGFGEDEVPDYERFPRLPKKRRISEDVNNVLPIKIDGKLERNMKVPQGSTPKEQREISFKKDEKRELEPEIRKDSHVLKLPNWKKLLLLDENSLERQQEVVKIELSSLCQLVISDPEKSFVPPPNDLHRVDVLLHLTALKHKKLQVLVYLSLTAVFRDILPDYKINVDLIDSQTKGVQLKKDVKRRYRFEKEMLFCYRRFISLLIKLPPSFMTVKVTSFCTLLEAKSNFNLRDKIIYQMALLSFKASTVTKGLLKQIGESFKFLFENDASSELSLEIVGIASRLMTKMSRSGTSYRNISTEFIESTLYLKLKVDLKDKSKLDRIMKSVKKRKQKVRRKDYAVSALNAASAVEDMNTKYARQAETLRELFMIYLRILKAPTDTVIKNLPAVLRGITRFIPMINLDIVQDILKVLSELLSTSELSPESSFRALTTVFTLLNGTARGLKYDESRFMEYFLVSIKEIVYSDLSQSQVFFIPLIKCLEEAYLKPTLVAEQQSLVNVMKIILLLGDVCLHVSVNETLCLLGVIKSILRSFERKHSILKEVLFETEKERQINGNIVEIGSVQEKTFWTLSQLQFHYHPGVQKFSRELISSLKKNKVERSIDSNRPYALLKAYDTSRGGFNPPISKSLTSMSKANYTKETINPRRLNRILTSNKISPKICFVGK